MNQWTKGLMGVMLVVAAQAQADSTLSNASALSVEGVAVVVSGSAGLLVEAGSVIVDGVSASAEGTVLVLKGVSEAGEFVVDLSVTGAGAASLVVGQTIEVTTSTAGSLLTVAGEVIAFLPNELAQALIHHGEHR